MTTTTDIIVAAALLTFLWIGWRYGIFRALIGPVSFCVSALIAVLHFDLNENIITALLIVSLGTIGLTITTNLIYWLARQSVEQQYKNYVFWGSRIAGSIVSAGWQACMIALVVIVVALMPENVTGAAAMVKSDVINSFTHTIVTNHVTNKITPIRNLSVTLDIINEPEEIRKLSETHEFKYFFEDERVQAVLKDEEIRRQLNEKDFTGFFANSKVQTMISDHKLMARFSRLTKKIYKERTKDLDKKEEDTPK